MRIRTTERGFRIAEFTDRYGEPCSIQESSLATEWAIWLGTNVDRMHLSQEMAADLIPLLQYFVDNGRLPDEIDGNFF